MSDSIVDNRSQRGIFYVLPLGLRIQESCKQSSDKGHLLLQTGNQGIGGGYPGCQVHAKLIHASLFAGDQRVLLGGKRCQRRFSGLDGSGSWIFQGRQCSVSGLDETRIRVPEKRVEGRVIAAGGHAKGDRIEG